MSVQADYLATHLQAGLRASGAKDISPHSIPGPPPERLVQFGAVDATPEHLPGDDDGAAVDDLGGTA